ncbi:hypothetical protein TruAng_003900 [Truncatella angustata]|nr:hypothetical protein TruAng_003900 [Truncatella angustata]
MDALAHYRRFQGLAATSINVGLVTDSDHTIDGIDMENYLDRSKHMASVSTTLEKLDIAIIASMRGTVGDGEHVQVQFVYCMTDSLHPEGVDGWARDRKFIHRTAIADNRVSMPVGESSAPSTGEQLGAAKSRGGYIGRTRRADGLGCS